MMTLTETMSKASPAAAGEQTTWFQQNLRHIATANFTSSERSPVQLSLRTIPSRYERMVATIGAFSKSPYG